MKKRKGELKKKTLLTIGLELRFHKLSCSRSGGWSAEEKGGRKTTQRYLNLLLARTSGLRYNSL